MAADQVTITKHTLAHKDFLHLDWVKQSTNCEYASMETQFIVPVPNSTLDMDSLACLGSV